MSFGNLNLIFMAICFLFFVLYLIRVQRVFNFRVNLIDKISTKNREELFACTSLLEQDEWAKRSQNRWGIFTAVSFNSMTLQIWKPLDSFFDMEKLGLR